MDIIKTLNELIEDVFNENIDSLAELQRELIYLKSKLEENKQEDTITITKKNIMSIENKTGSLNKEQLETIYNKWQLQDKDLGNTERYQFTKSELLDFSTNLYEKGFSEGASYVADAYATM